MLMIAAVARAPEWPRVLLGAAKLAEQLQERDVAWQYLKVVFSPNAAWAAEEIGSGDYAELGANATFHTWVSPEKEQRAASATYSVEREPQAKIRRESRECFRKLDTPPKCNRSWQIRPQWQRLRLAGYEPKPTPLWEI